MVNHLMGIGSAFVLGALHSLEPGHGKSLLALQTTNTTNFRQAGITLMSLLVSHFTLVILIAMVFYAFPSMWHHITYFKILTSCMIIAYALYLIFSQRINGENNHHSCSCSSDSSNSSSHRSMSIGILAGLTPCPSVLTPIFLAIGVSDLSVLFQYILSYMFGVVSVFVLLFMMMWRYREQMRRFLFRVSSRLNPHLIGGGIMGVIGCIYLFVALYSELLHSH